MIGQRLLHYEILEVLGQGGMGTVYKARDTRLNRLVALKVFHRDRVQDGDRRQRFMQEAQAASGLNHPHIVTIYDIGQTDGDWFIAMEYVPGRPLSSLIRHKGMPLRDVLRYAIQIADALACAHAAGIVHRDLKPANVMVTPHGATKLVDFGLAKLQEGPAWSDNETGAIDLRTREGTVLGTAAYMSPEQAEGRTVDGRSDVFSFGAMLYEMATGRRAFRGESAISTLSAVLSADPQPMTGQVPRDLEKIITRCLRKDPQTRYQSMADVRVVLEDVEHEVRPRRRRSSAGSRRLFWGAAGVIAAVIAAAGGWLLTRPSPGPGPPVKVMPLATYPGVKDFPAISRDGSAVAFSWRKPGTDNFDLYVLRVGGGPPVQRTTSPEDDYFASWSPDGQTIVFVRGSAFGANEIIAIPTLGGPEQRIASWGGAFFGPAWTADGRHLIVNDRPQPGRPLSLFSVSLDTGEKQPFVALPAGFTGIGDVAGVFSPDRRKLLIYRLVANLSGDLFVQPLSDDGVPQGVPSELTKQNLWLNGLGFAPDGGSVLFSGVREHAQALWRLSLSSPGAPERVAFGDQAAAFDVAYRANRMVFERRSPDSNVMRLDLESSTATPLQFLNSTREDMWPEYSPDGSRIALVSTRSGQVEIWVCDSAGGDPVQLTRNRGGLGEAPRWSPDGRSFALVSLTGSRWSPAIVSTDRGQLKRLATGAESSDESVPTWSRDGRWIYFSSSRSGSNDIWKIPSAGGQAVQVTRYGGFYGQESPDGKFLYYTKQWDYRGPSSVNELWRMPVDGGDETLVVAGIKSYRNVVVGRRGVYYARSESGHDSIRVHDLATGRSRLLFELSAPIASGLSLSPDERYLIYSQTDDEGSELMLADNFR
jgi:Tol biopolymer transport system component/tRNA A-37 threonylcarbamoyl transferase component Bud32